MKSFKKRKSAEDISGYENLKDVHSDILLKHLLDQLPMFSEADDEMHAGLKICSQDYIYRWLINLVCPCKEASLWEYYYITTGTDLTGFFAC